MEEWLSNQASGIAGGVIGVVSGLFGALVGCTANYCITRGKKKLLYGIFAVAILTGTVFVVFGITALICRQPYHVYFPFLLSGLIITGVFGGMLPVINKRFVYHEMQQMEAKDL